MFLIWEYYKWTYFIATTLVFSEWVIRGRGNSANVILERVAMLSSRGSSQPRDWTQVSRIAGTSEPPGKPKNTGVESLPLIQGNFLKQESNRGLLHCRQILYQLSYLGSPVPQYISCKFIKRYWRTARIEKKKKKKKGLFPKFIFQA